MTLTSKELGCQFARTVFPVRGISENIQYKQIIYQLPFVDD